MITIKQVNDHLNGDPGKLIGRSVDTPAGPGKISAVAGARSDYRAQVTLAGRKRQWFSLDEIDLAINYANAALLGWEE